MNRRKKWLAVGLGAVALIAEAVSPSWALYLDDARTFRLTGQFYTQTRMRTQDSDAPEHIQGGGTGPEAKKGQVVQWRNFAFPVLEGDLTKALNITWLNDVSFRLAGRLIYDGVYDFGAGQYRRALRRHIVSANSPCPNDGSGGALDPNCQIGLGGRVPVAIYQGTKPVERQPPASEANLGPCGVTGSGEPFFSPLCQLADQDQRAARLRDQEVFNPRNEFTQQVEPWEIYMNIQKGLLFVRVGRQNLAWGESDGQRLLDGINPLDRLFGLPFDEDIDEQRIPLWMLRTNLQLIDTWGPLSSFGLESFLVPGVIDTTQNPIPIGADFPYAPPSGCDPQFIADEVGRFNFGGSRPTPDPGCAPTDGGLLPRGTVKTTLYERLPEKTWHNSRWGVRLLGIAFRDYTFSLGMYRSWADAPAPRVHFTDLLMADFAQPPDQNQAEPPLPTAVIAELTHDQLTVIGGTLSFFQPHFFPGVVRSEVGYFMDEPALVPIANLGSIPTLPEFELNPTPSHGVFLDTFVPTADYVRWVIGYDAYQVNIPWISQTNNIIIVAQMFNSFRLTGDDRFQKLLVERGLVGNICGSGFDRPCSDLGRFDFGVAAPDGSRLSVARHQALGNITFQAFMMHGLLVPRITFVGDIEGWGSVLPNVEYRLRDDLLIRFSYSAIFGKFFGGGIFRDRDQIGARLTYLLS